MRPRDDYFRTLSKLQERLPAMTERLEGWVNINSYSRNVDGLREMSRELISAFSELGAEFQEITLQPYMEFTADGGKTAMKTGPALLWQCRPEAPHRILFCGHFDTVFSPESDFRKARIEDGKMHGPGAADMKGGLLIILESLKHFETYSDCDSIGWDVLLVPDEEVGSHASGHLFKEVAQKNDLALVYEPSLPDGSLARARKGSGTFNVVATGLSAHVGRSFSEGRSAIVALSKFIQAVYELNTKIDGAIFNVGHISGGGALNVVAEHAAAQFNFRITSADVIPEIDRAIAGIREQVESETGCQLNWEGAFTRPPKVCTPAMGALFSKINSLSEEFGRGLTWKDTGGCCDGNNLAALGLPCIDTLGVRGAGIHSTQEFAILESLPQQAALSALLLYDLSQTDVWPETSKEG